MLTATATLTQTPDTWSLTSTLPGFPPVAIPRDGFPTAANAQAYATALLRAHAAPDAIPARLNFHPVGHTVSPADGALLTSYRACFTSASAPAPLTPATATATAS